MGKPFKTVDEQVAILKDRGLKIKNENATAHYLLFNNYYNVVNYYGKFFQDNSDSYIEGATFDEIRYLFNFDKEIKSLLFKASLDIEKSLKALTSYFYSREYRNPYPYLDINNYQNPKDSSTMICIGNLLKLISSKTNKRNSTNKDSAISHYIQVHGEIPLWVLTNEMYFWTINDFYKNIPLKIRNNVARCFADSYKQEYGVGLTLDPDTLWKSMEAIRNLRNACGHNNRLLKQSFRLSVPFIPVLYPENFDKSRARDKVYDIYLCMSLYLKKEQFENLTRAIKDRMRSCLKHKIRSISYMDILESLGFPKDWID